MNNTHNVTVRQFAEKNNLALARLRILIKEDTVRVSAVRKNVKLYNVVVLDAWLVENKHRFTAKNVYLPIENGHLFYCSRCSAYVNIGLRSNKLSLCCVKCERSLMNRQRVAAKDPTTPSKTVDPIVSEHKKRVNRVMAQREIDSLQDVNAWMLD